jgi:hypothetical protein
MELPQNTRLAGHFVRQHVSLSYQAHSRDSYDSKTQTIADEFSLKRRD